MLAPFVRPEGLVIATDVDPVFFHVREQVGAALRFQDVRDVGVLARRIAIGLVGAVAVVGPGMSVSGHDLSVLPASFIWDCVSRQRHRLP